MRTKILSLGVRVVLAMFVVGLLATTICAATEKKLHNFGLDYTDGINPSADLISDAAGNLYGTTSRGGAYEFGTVFELMPNGSGGWTKKTLHNFGHGEDGTGPVGRLVFDTQGNLYGITAYGGDYTLGTAFELTPNGSGGWTEKKLHNFGNGDDGSYPQAGLIFDAAGNLYGTASTGGVYCTFNHGCGTVFELAPNGSGGWTEKTLHNFGYGKDGRYPSGALIFDAAGNLYGTTVYGGNYECPIITCGTVFELTPQEGGGWREKLLHNFGNGEDGYYPQGGLTFDAAGNLYGTASAGGVYQCPYGVGCGTAFELTPREDGGWIEKTLLNFLDGAMPLAGLTFDAAGNLYGTTFYGGAFGAGTVFELSPMEDGNWRWKTLHNFFNNGADGTYPSAGVIFDAAGNLYGTTQYGGNGVYGYCGELGCGTVFEITP